MIENYDGKYHNTDYDTERSHLTTVNDFKIDGDNYKYTGMVNK